MSKPGASSNTAFFTLFISCIKYLIIFVLFLFSALGAWGDAYTWTGNAGTDWRAAGNWTNTTVPPSAGGYPGENSDADTVTIPDVSPKPSPLLEHDGILGTNSFTIANLTVGPIVPSATLTLKGNVDLTVTELLTNNGTIDMIEGSSNWGSELFVNNVINAGTIIVTGGSGGLGTGDANITVQVGGTLINTGTININQNGIIDGTIDNTNGDINVNVDGDISGGTITGGTITETGGLTVRNAELKIISNTLTYAWVIVESGGTLTIDVGGSLTATGTLTNNGTIIVNGIINANGAVTNADTITTNGTFNIDNTLSNNGTLDGIAGIINITSTVDVTLAGTINTSGEINRSGGSTTINTDITAGKISFGSAVTLAKTPVTIKTTVGNITFNNTIKGTVSDIELTLAAVGKVTLTGAVGDDTTPLKSLKVIGNTIDVDAAVKTTGDITFTGNTSLGADVTTTINGDFLFKSPVTLGSDVTIKTTTSGNITFESSATINSKDATARSLTLTAVGTVKLGGKVGDLDALNLLTVTGGDGITIEPSDVLVSPNTRPPSEIAITTTGAISFESPVNFTASIDSHVTIKATAANITFAQKIECTSEIKLFLITENGDVTLTGDAGTSGKKFNELIVNDAKDVAINGSVYAGITYLTDIDTLTNITTPTNSFKYTNLIIDSGDSGQDTKLNNNIECKAFIVRMNYLDTLTIKNITATSFASTLLGGGSTGCEILIDTDTTTITAATSTVNFANGTTINSADTTARSLILNAVGKVTLTGEVGGTNALKSLTVSSANTESNAITVGANITTKEAIEFKSPVTLSANTPNTLVTIKTEEVLGNITFDSTINGKDSGVQGLTLSAVGTVTLKDAVGRSTPLESLTVTGSTIRVDAVDLNPTKLAITTKDGNILFNSPVTLTQTPVTITTTGTTDGNITFYDSATITCVTTQQLTLDAVGEVTLTETVEGIGANKFDKLTVKNATAVTIGSVVNATDVTFTDVTGTLTNIDTSFSSTTNLLFNDTTSGATPTLTLSSNINTCKNFTVSTSNIVVGGNVIATGAITVNNAITLGDTSSPSPPPSLTISTTVANGNITFKHPVTLGNNVMISTTASGNITFDPSTATINSADNTTARSLILSAAGTGKVTLTGIVGTTTTALKSLTVTGGGGITVNADITTEEAILFESPVTLSEDVIIATTTTGTITFKKTIEGATDDKELTLNAAGDITFEDEVTKLAALIFTGDGVRRITLFGGIYLSAVDLYFDRNTGEITLGGELYCKNFYFYRGKLNLGSQNITTIKTKETDGNFVVFGNGYSSNDPGWDGNDNRYAYSHVREPLKYYPDNSSIYNPNYASYEAEFADLGNRTITVGGNFYNNGADMIGNARWTLNILNNISAVPTINDTNEVIPNQWGIPYAVAFNMKVQNSKANGTDAWVAASAIGQRVTDSSPVGSTTNIRWQFGVDNHPDGSKDGPKIESITIIADNQVEIKFDMKINITQSLLDTTLAYVNFNGGNKQFTSVTAINSGIPECTTLTYTTPTTSKPNNSWNTDTITAIIDPDSTNSIGDKKITTPVIGNIQGRAFFAAEGSIQSQAYATDTIAIIDKCPPFLVSIETGKDDGRADAASSYNWHNYFQLRYSEPVNIGTAASINTPLVNVRATDSYSAGNYGGHLRETSPNSGTVIMTGFFTYPGKFKSGSIDGNDAINSIYRGTLDSNPNQYGYHGIRIYAAGYSTIVDHVPKWVGYMSDVTNPKDQQARTISRDDIKDAAGNKILDPPPIGGGSSSTPTHPLVKITTVTTDSSDLKYPDWIPPEIGPSLPDNYDEREIIQIDTSRNNLIDRFEIHILDNVDGETWLLANNPEDRGADTFEKGKGLRDNSFDENSGNYGFKIAEVGNVLMPLGSVTFDTVVFDPIFIGNGNPLTEPNDTYFSLAVNTSFNIRAPMIFSYDSSIGKATDLAGNLLKSVASAYVMNVTPPAFIYTMGSVGSNKVYSKFSKTVYNSSDRAKFFEPNDFSVIGAGTPDYYKIDKVIPLTTVDSGSEVGVDDAFFILNRPIEALHFLDIKFKPADNGLEGKSRIHMVDSHNVSDFAIGLIEPLWAADEYSSMAGKGYSIRNFTGNDKLPPVDITLEATITMPSSPLSVSMYFDADVPDSVKVGKFWLPTLFPGYNLNPNTDARGLSPFQAKESLRDFLVPGGDSEMKSGNEIEFIFTVAGRYAGRLLDPDDPRSIAPWKISLLSIKQRDGVTILNNVINVSRGEKTILTVDAKKSSIFTINIFSLSGNVVKQLYKGSLPAGNHSFTWDGTNIGGRKVARGIYFIRVVGPDVDEYRKVIVAKD